MTYTLRKGAPTVDGYLKLRKKSGLSPKTREQAEYGLSNCFVAFHFVEEETGEQVAMGRALGDGIFLQIVDMCVLPEHQRRGLGDKVLTALLDEIRRTVPKGAYVSLMADPPGRRLYARHGFVESADHGELGMRLIV